MKKSLTVMLSTLLVAGTVLAGCGSKAETGAGGETGKSSAQEQVFRMNLTSEPPTLDPALSQDNVSNTVINGLFEGLTRKDEKGATVPGIAEKWEVSDDQKSYTFQLRKDAKWSNGDPVTAHDFEYAWTRALDPKLNPPAPYAYQLYYLKNAQNYNVEKDNPNHITDPSQVGVKAKDDYTLEVQLEAPTPYFLSLLSFQTFFPVHKSAKDNANWAGEASTFISNGPFKLSSWKHSNSIELVPNENYYAKNEIKLTKVKFVMVKDSSTELNMYNTGQLDYTGKPTGEIPLDQLPKLKQEKQGELSIKGIASTYYYVFNTTAAPFDNLNIRKAFAMAIDRQKLVDKVTLSGELPAHGFVPPGIIGVKDEFRTEHKDDFFTDNIDEAKKLLATGLQEKGLTALPEIKLTYNTSDGNKKIAQAVADMWSKNLGVTVKLENQEWKVFLKNRTSLNYQIARSGWGADYNDPMTFIDLWTSKSGNNDSGFKSPEYDALVKEAYSTADQNKRVEAMAKAEKILMDNQVIMPLYYYSSTQMVKPNVKGLTIDYKGDIDYTRAYIE